MLISGRCVAAGMWQRNKTIDRVGPSKQVREEGCILLELPVLKEK